MAKKLFIYLAKLGLAAAILYYLYNTNLLNFKLIHKTIYDFAIISKIFLIVLLILFFGNLKWFILLRSQKIKISFLKCFELYYIGYAFNYLLPGGIAGDLVKIGYIRKLRTKRSIASISIIVDRIVGLGAMVLVILFFLPSLLQKINRFSWIVEDYSNFLVPYFVIISILPILAVFTVLSIIRNKVLFVKITSFLKRRNNFIFRILLKITKAIFSYRKSSVAILLNSFIAVLVQIIISFCLLTIGTAILNSEINIFNYNLASIVTQIIGMVPISPGGIGVQEAIFSKMMYYLNSKIVMEYASIYLIYRIVNLIASIPGIILFFLKKHDSSIA
jgi:hypothetical protein